MRKWMWLITFLFFLTSASFAADKALLLQINGAIGPAVQDYVTRGIAKAVEMKAAAVILQINTPGGLETSMRGINEAIITSPVPVIGFVAPSGARAASAGTFIMYASHFAVMAPGTNIGAASPVNLTPEQKSNPSTLTTHERKAMSDAAAYLRSLAELRGRNVAWADLAVTKAASVSAMEAKKLNIINDVAKDIPELLIAADGKKTLVIGAELTMHTKNLTVETLLPDWRNRFLAFITDPNIAYLLMLAALYGIFFEFSNPGLVLPGVAGAISLLLALYAFQLMPVNYVGLMLLLLGISFMIFEVYISSFGVIGIGGVIAFVVGSIMLYDTSFPAFRVTTTLILFMATLTAAFFVLCIIILVRTHKRAVVTGHEGLIGNIGTVITNDNGHLTIMIMGEIWKAETDSTVSIGDRVRVVKTNLLTLTVKPLHRD